MSVVCSIFRQVSKLLIRYRILVYSKKYLLCKEFDFHVRSHNP